MGQDFSIPAQNLIVVRLIVAIIDDFLIGVALY